MTVVVLMKDVRTEDEERQRVLLYTSVFLCFHKANEFISNVYDAKKTKIFETKKSYEDMISFCQAHLTVLNENTSCQLNH